MLNRFPDAFSGSAIVLRPGSSALTNARGDGVSFGRIGVALKIGNENFGGLDVLENAAVETLCAGSSEKFMTLPIGS